MTPGQARFAQYVATLGRGPGRSRALTEDEARDAMRLLLDDAAAPEQVGAFLMLLRYRGEDPAELSGLVRGANLRLTLPVQLDWPSYGGGKTRGAPWFLLAALALGQAGHSVLMHGTNEFSAGASVAEGLAALGLAPATDAATAATALAARGFAYLPVAALSPRFAGLLGLRHLLGLRSPLNTVARLLNPAAASASVDGVFHPPYIEAHLATAERLGQPRLVVLKGGGGEAERNPAKPVQAHIWDQAAGRSTLTLPPLCTDEPGPEPDFAGIWFGRVRHAAIEARIIGTITLGLLALGVPALRQAGDAQAQSVWEKRIKTA